jgi:CheY-like chemotaxis protein
VVDRAVRVANQVLQAHGDLVIRRGRPPRVRGDAGQLVQVVVLLLLNAARSLDPRRRADNLVSVVTDEHQGRARISVADNGAGMRPEIVERAFEPFVAGSGSGAGLGLSVARRLVENHGGTIMVETELSRGSAFRVSLPAIAATRKTASFSGGSGGSRPSPLPASGARARLRLLFVDDDAPLLSSYQRWLSRRYEVETSLGVEQALEVLAREPSFDAVFCDVMMPGTSGLDLFRAIEERWPALVPRVVFLTGGAFTREAQAELDRTKRPCLFKPFDIEDLEACLAALVAGPAASGTSG